MKTAVDVRRSEYFSGGSLFLLFFPFSGVFATSADILRARLHTHTHTHTHTHKKKTQNSRQGIASTRPEVDRLING